MDINEKKYIKKAARIWGMHPTYIDENIKENRGIDLFKYLYSLYDENKDCYYVFNDDLSINLNKTPSIESNMEISGASVQKILILPNLKQVILKKKTSKMDIKEVADFWFYNHLLIPYLVNQLDMESAEYYAAKKDNEIFILSPDFKKSGEELLVGLDICKSTINDKFIDIEDQIEQLQSYLEYRNFDENDIKLTVMNLKKQIFINKLFNNQDEANRNWGILVNSSRVRIAPLFDYDYYFNSLNIKGISTISKRILNNDDDQIIDIIKYFQKEEWFNNWINDYVINLDLEKAFNETKENRGVSIPEKYKQKYRNELKNNMKYLKSNY